MSLIPEKELEAETGSFEVPMSEFVDMDTTEEHPVQSVINDLIHAHPDRIFSAIHAPATLCIKFYWHPKNKE